MNVLIILLIAAGVIFQIPVMVKSGSLYDFGIGYWGPLARDGVWHEALVNQVLRNFPPDNPGFAGFRLTNYHYFYDLVVAGASAVTGVSPSFFIYKFFPIVFSLLLGVFTCLLASRLFKNKFISLLAVFFVYFGSSFGWIVEYIKRGSIWGGESAFWANQPVSMNLNPPFAISLIILIALIFLVDSYLTKSNKLKAAAIIILSGTLIGFKVYAGVIVLAGLSFLSLKERKLFLISIPSLLLSALIYFSQSMGSEKLLEFNPFWLVNTMIDAGDRVGIPNFTVRRFAYLGGGKWLHFFVLEALSFLIFFVGNLGTRIVALFGINKKIFNENIHFFILSMSAVSLVLPLIFTQKGNAWNIVQFFYYFLFFSSLYAAYTLGKIYEKLPKFASFIIIGAILVITPISSIATFRSWLYPNPPAKLTQGELDGLTFLKTQEDGVALKHPFDPNLRGKFEDPYPLAVYADNAYVSAYSRKPVFIEDVEQQIVLGTDYKNRLEDATRFFVEKDLSWSNQFLKENNISYIYLPKIYALPVAEQEYAMKKIFENEEVNIYRVTN